MFIAMNTIPVAAGQHQRMIEGFKHALPAMRQFSGFLGLEMWHGEDGTLLAVSRWTSKEAMDEYRKHDLFKSHHGEVNTEQADKSDTVNYYEVHPLS